MLKDVDFRQLIRDPKLYYILVPVICVLWPLWAALLAMPVAQKAWNGEKDTYAQVERVVTRIHELDPERFTAAQNQGKAVVFSFSTAVAEVTKSCGIPATEYKFQESAQMKSKEGQQTQDADITLKQVDIATFSRFLSAMQLRWADLQCTSLKLAKQKGTADMWKADMKFKYYF
jgi:hypothetical protein